MFDLTFPVNLMLKLIWWLWRVFKFDGEIRVSPLGNDSYLVVVKRLRRPSVVEVKFSKKDIGIRDNSPCLPFIPMFMWSSGTKSKTLYVSVWGEEQQEVVIPMRDNRKVVFKIPADITYKLHVEDYTTIINRKS